MGNCYRSKYSLNFKVGVCYHNVYLLHTLADTHRTLQGTLVITIMDIRFRSTLSNLPVDTSIRSQQ